MKWGAQAIEPACVHREADTWHGVQSAWRFFGPARANVCVEVRAMPTYEFRCNNCGTVFERQEHIAEHEKSHPPCPKCNSKAVQPVLAEFYTVTSKKS